MLFFDSTLRDGAHAVHHQLTKENISDYCQAVDEVGMHTIIVGHGNGLGASSLQVGEALLTDAEMLDIARKNLKISKLGAFLLPGFGTIRDDLDPAFDRGVDLVCIASHCTEANITRQHIEFTKKCNKEAYGVLMLQHTIDNKCMLEQCKLMESYGVDGIILMDSAGASLPDFVGERFDYLVNRLSIPIGFHAHNNLGLAISNSLEAIKAGASIIDGTTRGFGAGAGNCQLEVLVACLEKINVDSKLDLYKLMDASENVVKFFSDRDQGISSLNLISGIAGVFSSYAPHVQKAAEAFDVDPRDVFIELGKRNTVGGQEDIVVEVASKLSERLKR